MKIVSCILAGLSVGYIALRLLPLGIFIIGAGGMLTLAIQLRSILVQLYPMDSELEFYVACGLLGLVGGALA